jgi:hypothetical protein
MTKLIGLHEASINALPRARYDARLNLATAGMYHSTRESHVIGQSLRKLQVKKLRMVGMVYSH